MKTYLVTYMHRCGKKCSARIVAPSMKEAGKRLGRALQTALDEVISVEEQDDPPQGEP